MIEILEHMPEVERYIPFPKEKLPALKSGAAELLILASGCDAIERTKEMSTLFLNVTQILFSVRCKSHSDALSVDNILPLKKNLELLLEAIKGYEDFLEWELVIPCAFTFKAKVITFCLKRVADVPFLEQYKTW